MQLAWEQRFFLEDAAMRLYSAAEHLAEAIASYAELDPREVKAAPKTSQWVKVAYVLKAHASHQTFRESMLTLRRVPAWKRCVSYRNAVVHQQPPLLGGSGLAWRRRNPWQQNADGSWTMVVRTSDPPQEHFPGLHDAVVDSTAELVDRLGLIWDAYWERLASRGVRNTPSGVSIPLGRAPN
jgi:hypothetical protein